MKRIIYVSFFAITIFIVGCNAQNEEMTFIEQTQDERLDKNEQHAEIEGNDDDLSLGDEVNEETSEPSEKKLTIMTYDEGHQQLQKVIDTLYEHTSGLDRADYKGYVYSIDNLYYYLLAIYYKGEDLLEPRYPYNYPYESFEELTKTYHEYVDFSSIELEELKHDYDIEIELSYINKNTHKKGYLNYYISYSKHELKDLSNFN
ncbi:hypothetical protein [Sporosarcina koreensis]|uniref:DUF5067 domain-containing protein n=1 Tax=Sporosarcina koreensis TaxID=334735 RepID=A0ABW0TUG4_9BACL